VGPVLRNANGPAYSSGCWWGKGTIEGDFKPTSFFVLVQTLRSRGRAARGKRLLSERDAEDKQNVERGREEELVREKNAGR